MLEKITSFITGIMVAIGGFFTPTPVQDAPIEPAPIQEESFGAFSPVAGGTYRLKTSIGTSDTTIILSAFTEPITGNPLTMTSLATDIGYATIDPQSSTRKEFVSFTGITQNADGSATLTGVSRGLGFQSPFTASSTLRKSHPGQSIFILSDSPQLFSEYARRRADETITGYWTVPTPLSNSNPATKAYVDSVVTGGAITIDNVSVRAIAGETFATGTIVYFDSVQHEWMKASATNTASSTATILGIAQGAGSNGSTINAGVLIKGYDTTQTGGTAGQTVYLSNIAGATSTSAGVYSIALGMYKDETTLYFDPQSLNTFVANGIQTKAVPFGGTGVDGDLNITSGTTTLDLNSKSVYNYKSVTIANGAALTFSGGNNGTTTPIIKVQGNFTNRGYIYAEGKGVSGGTGGAGRDTWTVGTAASGTPGTDGMTYVDTTKPEGGNNGTGANITSIVANADSGSGGATALKNATYFTTIAMNGAGGAGGGGGAIGNTGNTAGAGGNGGNGGLGIYIEVAGNYENTGRINLNGANGSNGTNSVGNGSSSTDVGAGGAGGGGGAGSLFVLYNGVIINTGTTTVSGGSGGTGGYQTNTGGGGGTLYQGAGGGGGGGGSTFFMDGYAAEVTPSSSATRNGGNGGNGGNGIICIKKL